MWLVHVRQTNAVPAEKPLEWWLNSLNCTVGGPTKRGVHIEDRKPQTADTLERCLAFAAITARQVSSLARDARHTLVEDVLTRDQRDGIETLVHKSSSYCRRGSAAVPHLPIFLAEWCAGLQLYGGGRALPTTWSWPHGSRFCCGERPPASSTGSQTSVPLARLLCRS